MTKFRGCIDIHAGQVKQIVGGTLTQDDAAPTTSTTENFVSTKPASFYANLYKTNSISGCHVIKLGSNTANDEAAKEACSAWPGHLQVGGGITLDNALEWLDTHRASQVIITSWLFTDAKFDWTKLAQISRLVGKDRLVVDLSCRAQRQSSGATRWFVAINKWQTITDTELDAELLAKVAAYASEILIHAADVEGLCNGIDETLVARLGDWCPAGLEGRIVYAGGAKSVDDLETVASLSGGKVDLTFGSALDIFGGKLVKFEDVASWGRS